MKIYLPKRLGLFFAKNPLPWFESPLNWIFLVFKIHIKGGLNYKTMRAACTWSPPFESFFALRGQLCNLNPSNYNTFWLILLRNFFKYSRDCGLPRRPWANAGRKKLKNPSKNPHINLNYGYGAIHENVPKLRILRKIPNPVNFYSSGINQAEYKRMQVVCMKRSKIFETGETKKLFATKLFVLVSSWTTSMKYNAL